MVRLAWRRLKDCAEAGAGLWSRRFPRFSARLPFRRSREGRAGDEARLAHWTAKDRADAAMRRAQPHKPARARFAGLACGWLAACVPPPLPAETSCSVLAPGELHLTEYQQDPQGVDTGAEFLELHNPGAVALPLQGLSLFTAAVSGTNERVHVLRDEGEIAPGAYFALGDVRSGELPPGIQGSYGAALGAFRNEGGLLGLRCGEETVDQLLMPPSSGSGAARSRVEGVEPAWCEAAPSPGAANGPCLTEVNADTCLEEDGRARPLRRPQAGQLFFTEVMADPVEVPDAQGEWLELVATASVDLNGVTLRSGRSSQVLRAPRCVALTAGQRVLIARTEDPTRNGGLPQVRATFQVSLSNEGAPLELRSGETSVDTVEALPVQAGLSLQLGSEYAEAAENDAASHWCAQVPSPGVENLSCSGRTPGDAVLRCMDPKRGGLRAVREGRWLLTEVLSNPRAVADASGEWVEVQALAAGDLNGLELSSGASRAQLGAGRDCMALEAGAHALFARDAEPSRNGGLPAVQGVFHFSLPNDGSLQLRLMRQGQVEDTFLDAAPAEGRATQRDRGARVCSAAVVYGAGDRGSPGKENPSCAP